MRHDTHEHNERPGDVDMDKAPHVDPVTPNAGHRHAAKVRRWRAPGLALLIQRATPFTGAVMVTTEDTILETVTVLSEARQLVKAFRREAGNDQPLSPRQWKKARRQLRRAGLL